MRVSLLLIAIAMLAAGVLGLALGIYLASYRIYGVLEALQWLSRAEQIAEVLNLSARDVEAVLAQLQRLGLVEQDQTGGWYAKKI